MSEQVPSKEDRDRDSQKEYAPSKDYAEKYPPREPRGGGGHTGGRDYPKSNSGRDNKIYVGGLNFSATKDDIYDVFSEAGKVINIQLVVDHETQRSKGYAFVTFADEDAYLYALRKMNGVQVKGRSVVVNKALNPEEKAQFEREKGTQHRDRDDAPQRRPYHSERPHYERPPGPKVKGYRVTVYGLPESYTWRELKDFLRTQTNAQPTYANIERPGVGYYSGVLDWRWYLSCMVNGMLGAPVLGISCVVGAVS
ncbi:hypothetical protein HYH02_008281 [Chlamydomonas schloesseri]|uniref:RRM domain-containing protein n=1 Tax=Chlamydomonas schloesseri TaxID=2026947 RepID=A0A835WGG3_9CHLO|nr:hypothetical protein HYH02_008281 [Chlamydomonas schloesseri]|eukprot:KAG2446716.1 hypothetical protein HYH02_008281 [Chlamydomonas schloesseri]